MVHHSDRDPRPGDVFRSLAIVNHPRRFVRPAVWVFATALAPCLCASEARPSDRGIQISRHPTAKPSFQPHVRRETVAAGRGSAPATVLNPGAGPASPDIASSGVSEGGTGTRVKQGKWWGMKKVWFFDFVGEFGKFIPLRLRELRVFHVSFFGLCTSPCPLPAGGERGCQRWPSRPSPRFRGEGARRADEGRRPQARSPSPPWWGRKRFR
jgi:hypothetical protein